jgi:hypothetical protein
LNFNFSEHQDQFAQNDVAVQSSLQQIVSFTVSFEGAVFFQVLLAMLDELWTGRLPFGLKGRRQLEVRLILRFNCHPFYKVKD